MYALLSYSKYLLSPSLSLFRFLKGFLMRCDVDAERERGDLFPIPDMSFSWVECRKWWWWLLMLCLYYSLLSNPKSTTHVYIFSLYLSNILPIILSNSLFSPEKKNLIELVACRVCVLLPCAFLCVDWIVWDGNGRPFYLDCQVCKEKSVALASSHPTLLSFQIQKVESAATKTNS